MQRKLKYSPHSVQTGALVNVVLPPEIVRHFWALGAGFTLFDGFAQSTWRWEQPLVGSLLPPCGHGGDCTPGQSSIGGR